ncbi:MAG: hypothetical protein V2B18_17710, partial [Pseudomonadota bacterium]
MLSSPEVIAYIKKNPNVNKSTFDAELLKLSQEGKVSLLSFDDPGRFSDAQKAENLIGVDVDKRVSASGKQWFNAVVPREKTMLSIINDDKWSADEWVRNVIEGGKDPKATPTQKASAKRAQEAKEYFEGDEYREDTAAATKTIVGQAGQGKLTWRGKKIDTTVLERWISSPEHYFEKIPAAWRVFQAAMDREDDYHRTYMHLTANDADLVAIRQFRKEREKEYERLMNLMVAADQNRKNYTEEGLRTKGFSDQAIAAWKSYRGIMDRGFDALTAEIRKIIETCERLGMPLPDVVIHDESGETVTVDLKTALAQMGDLRGSYMPRSRPAKRIVMMATKEGVNPIREHFDLGLVNPEGSWWKDTLNRWTPLEKRVRQLRDMGYDVTVEESRAMPEDVFQLAGKTVAIGAMLNQALERAQGRMAKKAAAKEKPIEEASYDEVMAAFDQMSEKESDIASLFANELAESLANTIKGRGFRSGMIARNKAKGKAVWVGYETDLLKSAAQYVSGLSAGIAKRDMAAKMVKAFSGTDIDRKDYASDEEYMKEVERRRIDPTEQRNAFHDVTKFMEHVLRNEEFADRVIGAIKGAVVLKYIAGRLASPLINLTALVTSVPAAMHGYGDIPFAPGLRSLGRAMADYRTWRWGDASTLNPDTKWIMDQIHERGWHN